MKINATHPEYDKFSPLWAKCRDCIEGEEAVKSAKTLYLPTLSGGFDRYAGYLTRALFFNATGRTSAALQGFLFRKPVRLLPDLAGVSDFAQRGGILDFIRQVSASLIAVGRVGILIDAPVSGGDPTLSIYHAEDIINWRTDAQGRPTLVVLRECRFEPKAEDFFELEETIYYRVLRLEEGVYVQEMYQEEDGLFPLISKETPLKNGVFLDYIPFVCINATGVDLTPLKPPLLDVVNVNLSHYRSSADLEAGRHFVAFPTPWAAGFDMDEGETLEIGSVAWVTDNTDARAGFLEFTGQGLGALENALVEKSNMMAVLGARILEAQKKASEAADTHRIRYAGEQSVLSEIARSSDEGISQAFRMCADWRNLPDADGYGVELNRDYAATVADPQLVATMFAAMQGSAISYDTWFENLKAWELVPESRTLDEELALIEARRGDEFGA